MAGIWEEDRSSHAAKEASPASIGHGRRGLVGFSQVNVPDMES